MTLPVAPLRARVVQKRRVSMAALEPVRAQPDWIDMMRRTAAGDHAALAELYDASSHLVFGLALRILGDRDTAEEAVVDVYAQAWREAKNYDAARGTACAWLMTLARSRSIDILRSQRRERATDPLESAGDVEASTPDPEAATSDAERHRFVHGAMNSLSSEQREAIELAYFAGLSHSEIAARLGQPLGTVKTRIRLGMMRLREVLGHLRAPAWAVEGRN